MDLSYYDLKYTETYTDLMWIVSVNEDTTGSDNGLSPVWYQAIIWTNTWLLSIDPIANLQISI